MTFAELIAQLQVCPADLEVVVASYEQGYDPVTDLREIAIDTAAAKNWYKYQAPLLNQIKHDQTNET